MGDISVALCTDEYSLAGLFITINSIIKNCATPSRLFFYILVSENAFKHLLTRYSEKLFGKVNIKIEVVDKETENRILGYNEYCKDNLHCKNLMNFSRFFIGDIFQELHTYLYIDTDYLIVDDIATLWDSIDKTEEFYAIPSEYSNERAYSLTEVGKHCLELSHRRPFNAGIYIVNVDLWRSQNRTEEFIAMINSPALQRMFRFGTQPLLNYVYQNTYVYLPTRWNRIAYDKIIELGDQRPIDVFNILVEEELVKENISALHFAGVPKPWLFTNQLSGGCWPSPNSMYKKYLPYKESYILSKSLLDEHKMEMDLLKNVLNDIFSVNLIFTSKTVSNIEAFFTSHIQESASNYTSPMYYIVIGGNIVMNNTGQTEDIVKHIHSKQPEQSDGIFFISSVEEKLFIIKKNLLGPDTIKFSSKENEVNFKKLIYAYVFLELLR